MLAMKLTRAFHENRRAVQQFNRTKPALMPAATGAKFFLTGTFPVLNKRTGEQELKPVFIHRRHVSRSKYSPDGSQ